MLRFVTSTIRSAVLLLPLLILSEASHAQTRVAALRDYRRVSRENRDNPRGYYFIDRHHDLDKFAGEWEGVGVGTTSGVSVSRCKRK